MAEKRKTRWSQKDLASAIQAIKKENLSLRTAADRFGVPKSTLNNYLHGKSEIGTKPGPSSILSRDEEAKLVQYAIHMTEIGYGRTKQQLQYLVKQIIEKDGRPNPFSGNLPGKKWWQLFKQRHPEISLRKPEHLQLARAKCCTSDVIQSWFTTFEQFLLLHKFKDKANRIWNADEAGFPLCPSTGRVIALRNSKCVYSITGDTKQQITCLCAVNAAGEALPPLHIFAGERFHFNPMHNCVPGAYFGRSPNGWISTELFFGWLANHFAKLVTIRPVLLLVDGHSSHIDLEVIKFCRENFIYLYCLPPHSSHLTQPLDVSFFKPLKNEWSKACDKYRISHNGQPVTKHCFSEIFHETWDSSVKVSTIVNGFRASGICPFNPKAISSVKLAPSEPYMEEPEKLKINSVKPEKLQMLESMMKPETLQVFEKRLEEEYDLETDELYCIWSGLKKLAISGSECIQQEEPKRKTELFQEKLKDPGPSVSPEMQLSLSSVQKKSIPSGLDEILQ